MVHKFNKMIKEDYKKLLFHTHCPWRSSIEKRNGHWLIIYVENQHRENLILNTQFKKKAYGSIVVFGFCLQKCTYQFLKKNRFCVPKLETAKMQVMRNLIPCLDPSIQHCKVFYNSLTINISRTKFSLMKMFLYSSLAAGFWYPVDISMKYMVK